ncbi:MAG TPA: IclR family transcriptional regulator [Marmoricola sp.]|nr:IclR family transcriptional regulator [Marmoricola sp.]
MSQSVGRALQILIQLGDGPANLDELAAATGVHKTTVLRLLRTLAQEQFVVRDSSHRFYLGSRVFELSSRALDQREVRRVAGPHLAAFNRKHGRTTHLAVLEDGEAVYIDKLESHDQIRMYSRIGLHPPLHSSAVGKVLLADLPEAERTDIVSHLSMSPTTPNTITDPDTLLAELDAVRQQGWAHDREENEPSINCIAAPVRGASGRTVAAVSVSVPDVVLTYDQLLNLLPDLLEVTTAISQDFGWQPDLNHDKELTS